MAQWDALVDAALARLEARSLLRATRPIALAPPPVSPETFAGPGPWDRAAVEIRLDHGTLHQWLAEGRFQAKLPLSPLWKHGQRPSDAACEFSPYLWSMHTFDLLRW
jgi:8-amino-7-oxononanoate synthase